MKLTIETCPFYIDKKDIEIRTYFDDGIKILQIREIIKKEICNDKNLMKRMIDRLFYEMKNQVYKHFALKGGDY